MSVAVKIRVIFLSLVLLTMNSCASMGSVKEIRTDIANIWSRLTELGENDERQDIKLSRLEKNMIKLSLSEDLLFSFASSKLNPSAGKRLRKVSAILSDYPELKFVVSGHTDSVGSEKSNLRLSKRRAEVVAEVLFEGGIPQENIQVVPRGEADPIATNSTAYGRKQNRRVEVSIGENLDVESS